MPISVSKEALIVPACKARTRGRLALRVNAITGLTREQCKQLLELAEYRFVTANALLTWMRDKLGSGSPEEVSRNIADYLFVRAMAESTTAPYTSYFRAGFTAGYAAFPAFSVAKINRWLACKVVSSQTPQDKLPQIELGKSTTTQLPGFGF